jgi:hypothetical protein
VLALIPDVYWRREKDCVVIVGPAGVMKMTGDLSAAWGELESHKQQELLSEPARDLLEELTSLGYVYPSEDPGQSWNTKAIGHLPERK